MNHLCPRCPLSTPLSMTSKKVVEVIELDDDLDEDLIALCDRHIPSKAISTNRPQASSSSSSNQYFPRKTPHIMGQVQPKATATKSHNDTIDLEFDDFDDEDLLEAVSFLNKKHKAEPPVASKSKVTVYTKPTNENSSAKANYVFDAQISEEDSLAIAQALQELEHSFNRNENTAASKELIELIELSDLIEQTENENLESYNENAPRIRSLSIIHPDLEHLDPNPDIHQLFAQFDRAYFDGFLSTKPLKIGWANNFYSDAGVFYSHKNGPTIMLSANLLTLRPRRDLVETLLHEMIHAFIYLQKLMDNNSHGKIFQFHMNRINRMTGTTITIYHSFHNEVSYLRKFIWRCNGSKCQSIQPYRGYISLPTKRKPSRWDHAFRLHQQIGCSGSFVQVSNNFK